MGPEDRYTVISADCRADLLEYGAYLDPAYRADFDTWAETYVNPYQDLSEPDAERNWNSERRNADLDREGVAGEVLYPNTVPPFFPRGSLAAPAPETPEELEYRWAGLRAHNRWLADLLLAPQRPGQHRANPAQLDADQAVAGVHEIAKLGLRGGVLLPGVAPGTGIPPLYAEHWEPLWAACADTGVVVNHHGGNAGPSPEDEWGSAFAVWVYETSWWAHRILWHLILNGTLERHPDMTLVLTEQGSGWVPAILDSLDITTARYARAGSAIARFAETAQLIFHQRRQKSTVPPVLRRRQLFLRRAEIAERHGIGLDRICGAPITRISKGPPPTPARRCGSPSPTCRLTRSHPSWG